MNKKLSSRTDLATKATSTENLQTQPKSALSASLDALNPLASGVHPPIQSLSTSKDHLGSRAALAQSMSKMIKEALGAVSNIPVVLQSFIFDSFRRAKVPVQNIKIPLFSV